LKSAIPYLKGKGEKKIKKKNCPFASAAGGAKIVVGFVMDINDGSLMHCPSCLLMGRVG
jgi:hypothetical protein